MPARLSLILVALVVAGGSIYAMLSHRGSERGGPAYAEARQEAREEIGELQEPGDAILARELFGSGKTVPSDVWRRAIARSRAIGGTTARRAPRAAGTDWEYAGPSNIGGRVLDIAVDPARPDTIYVASAGGGVWKSTDAGKTLAPAWPASETQNIGALVISPTGVLYAGTGETGPGGGSLTYGGTGVYRSADGGASWQLIGLPTSSRIGRIVLDPTNEKRIFVAVSGPLYKPSAERGLYRSEDGGTTWQKVLAGDNDTTGAADIAIDPKNPKRMFATMWDHQREPDVRRYNGAGSGLYRSLDGGTTWARAGAVLFGPNPELGRMGVAIAPNNPDTVYVVASGLIGGHTGFFISNDFGDTWTPRVHPLLIAGPLTYGWWFGRVWVDPADDQHIYVAGLDLLASTDGGLNWAAVTGGAHADQHALVWDPKTKGRMYLGNDGGVYTSNDSGGAWDQAKVMPFSQLYGVDVGEQTPSRLVAGLQDNGVIRNYPANRGGQWNSWVGGDGQRSLINPKDQEIVYGCYQYGACYVSHNGGDDTTEFTNSVISTRKNWFTPIELDPVDPHTVYTGGEIMSRSDDDGATWTPISLDLSNGPGRETNPLFINFGTLTTIAPAPKDDGTIYAGTDDGNLWYTHGGGLTSWTKASDPDLPKAWITRVEIDRADPMTAYVTYSGFRTGDDAAYVLRTRDGGVNWVNITGGLPRAPANDINVIGDALVVATDVGVFFSRDAGDHWLKAGGNLPLAPIFELRAHFPTRTLYVATFGRGVWKASFDALSAPVTNLPPVIAPAKRLTLGLPRTRSCKRNARLAFRIRAPKGTRLRSAAITVNGHRVKTLRGAALRRTVRLKLPRGRARVTIVARTTTGARLVGRRTYRACPKRR